MLVALTACQPSSSPRGPIAAAFPAPAAPCPSALAPVDDTPQPPDVEPPPAADAAIYAPSTEQEASARKLAGSILVGGHAFDYLRDLTDTYGARLTGSPAYALAAAWAAESFKRAGVDSVRFEEVTIPHGWERRDASARLVAPLDRALHVLPSPWSEPTPPEGVRGEVYVLTDFSTEAIRARSSALRGKIVLASRDVYSTKGKYSWPRIVAAPAELKKAGALAILMYSDLEGQAMRVSSGGTLSRIDSPIPRALIGQEDALLLRRLSEKGPVTITYANTSPVTGPVKVPEVIAEIRGREKPDEWVLVGAHLDSWDLATGAQDNGSGSAEVLEAARAIRALGVPSRRSIRFALFCGEEQGLYGSESYVRAHAMELDKGVLVLVSDGGAGAPIGWDLNGREDAKRAGRSYGGVDDRKSEVREPLSSSVGHARQGEPCGARRGRGHHGRHRLCSRRCAGEVGAAKRPGGGTGELGEGGPPRAGPGTGLVEVSAGRPSPFAPFGGRPHGCHQDCQCPAEHFACAAATVAGGGVEVFVQYLLMS